MLTNYVLIKTHNPNSFNGTAFLTRKGSFSSFSAAPKFFLYLYNLKLFYVVILTIFASLTLTLSANANNLVVSNVSKYAATSDKQAVVEFDISWANSWFESPDAVNPGANHDAVWLFIKYSTDSGTTWYHGTLSAAGLNPDNFSVGTDGDTAQQGDQDSIEIFVPEDKKGCLIRRDEVESGTLDRDDVRIVWDYYRDGVTDANAATAYVRLIGIEMVNIPQGGFFAGDGGTPSTNTRANFTQGSSDNDPWYISSETAIYITNTTSNGYYYTSASNSGESSTGGNFILPNAFPKGFGEFYIMKYEITQAQYRDFLNMLTSTQRTTRCSAVTSGRFMCATDTNSTPQNRNGIRKRSSGAAYGSDLNVDSSYDGASDGQWISCNWLTWMDLCGYADWAALRPITELEYEKACRGEDVYDTATNFYAWGTTGLTQVTGPSNSGAYNEVASNTGNGLCNYNNTMTGPFRAGFAATASTTRVTSGGAYYGGMDMSGNVWELCVTVGNTTGRSFIGTHGDGTLSTNGNATNADWPGASSGEVTGATGSGRRGGGYSDASTQYIQTSDRRYAAEAVSTRLAKNGGRLARTMQ